MLKILAAKHKSTVALLARHQTRQRRKPAGRSVIKMR
jgi:hypothetical protein